MLTIIFVIMDIISLVSFIRYDKSSLSKILEAFNNLSQYKLSLASFCAILYLCIKSALLSPDWAS